MKFNNAKILKAHQKKAEQAIRGMVTVMGNDALNHFEQSFRDQGFTDDSLERWKGRKKREREGRAILTKTGRLRRSLKKKMHNRYAIIISSNVVYAPVHNEGIGKMPKRQFVGYSGKLNRQLIRKFDNTIKQIFQ